MGQKFHSMIFFYSVQFSFYQHFHNMTWNKFRNLQTLTDPGKYKSSQWLLEKLAIILCFCLPFLISLKFLNIQIRSRQNTQFSKSISFGYTEQTRCRRGCSINTSVANYFIHSLRYFFPPNLQNTKTCKPLELETWNFDTISITSHWSGIICKESCVTCHVSCVMYHMSDFFDKMLEIVSGRSVINEAYPV